MLRRSPSVALFILLLLCGGRFAAAQGLPFSGGGVTVPSVDSIQAQLTEVQNAEGLEESARESAVASLQRALEDVRRAGELGKEVARLRALRDQAPGKLESIRAELAAAPITPGPSSADASLAELEQELTQANAALQAARQQVTDLQGESAARSERRGVIPQQLAALRERLTELQAPVQGEGEPSVVWQARVTEHWAKRFAVEREIASLEAELASYDARQEVLPARRDLAQRRVTEAERLVEALQGAVSRQRQAEAERAAREADRLRRDAARQHPALQAFAEATSEIAAVRVGAGSLSTKIDETTRRVTSTRSARADIVTRATALRQRIETVGFGRATGLQLRRLYEGVPDPLSVRRDLRRTSRALDEAEYDLLEYQEARLEIGDIDRVAQGILSEAGVGPGAPTRAEFEAAARELGAARRDLLDQVIAEQMRYRDQLSALRTEQDALLATAKQWRDYIEERILWVRSIERESAPTPAAFARSGEWLFDTQAWGRVRATTSAYVRSSAMVVLLAACVVILLWVVGFRVRRVLRTIGGRVARFKTDRFAYTIAAILLTGLLALPLPLGMYLVGWLLGRPQEQPEIGIAFGAGLQRVALAVFPAMFLYHAMRPQGLTEAHFRWPAPHTRPVRSALRWLLPILVPASVVAVALDRVAPPAVNGSLGRLALTIGLLALAVFLHWVLRPSGPTLRQFLEKNNAGMVNQLRRLWRPLLVIIPITLVVLSWMGYHYSALRLEARFVETLVLVLVLVFADATLVRWLFIVRRRVAVEDARRRREQAMAAEGEDESAPSTPAPPAIDEDKIDLPAISSQTRQLFRAGVAVTFLIGMLVIWSEALPALRMLDRVEVWPNPGLVDQQALEASDAPAAPTPTAGGGSGEAGAGTPNGAVPGLMAETPAPLEEEPPSVITLADIGISIVALIATWLAFRNVPGLFEIILLQRLPLDTGSRYAISTVLRYIIVIVGVFVAFGAIGITWNKVQWLAAALTFGLAFGLQEVFANFVSGLIILAERPVRIGDTVTVGGVSGTVTRIRMRATTIADWDRKELIIPNKTFITSDVINWTLSDSILRIRIPVGVSYDSDVKLVEETLRRLALASPRVLRDPAPQVLFKAFGDSTLDFELRIFIPTLEHWVPVGHELHNAIIEAFRELDIEIAFPQRDLHIRSGPFPVAIDRADAPLPDKADAEGPGRSA
ncbi:MAG: mechanosensitive ion channel domain-containing protein [Phycisphaerales bacterium JB059]